MRRNDSYYHYHPGSVLQAKVPPECQARRQEAGRVPCRPRHREQHPRRENLDQEAGCLVFLTTKKAAQEKNRQIKKYRKFFKANSNVRDLDIIRGKIAALAEGAPGAEKLLGQLQKKRKAELGRAGKLGLALKKMQTVQLDSGSSIPAGKLESRIDRAAGKLGVKVNDAFPVVLSDSSKVEELHRLRKDCKKLRYILEMVPPAGRKKYERAVSLALALEELQDMLGAIRDSDITIEYLQGSRTKVAGELAAREAGNRDRLYRDLVRRAKQATTTPLRRAQ